MNPSRPFFSIVIPTRNRSAMLARAVSSCLAQDFPDFELLIVDDGSSDATPAVARRFEDGRIRYLRREQGGGAAAARNHGIRQAGGRYAAFLDDDDAYLPRFLERTAEALRTPAEPVDFTWCGVRRIFAGKHGGAVVRDRRGDAFVGGREALAFAKEFAASHGFVARRKILLDVEGFDESLRVSEDVDLLLRLLARGCRYAALPDVLIQVHIHPTHSLSRSTDAARYAACNARMVDKNLSFLERHKALWLHYHDTLAADYYRAGDASRARRTILRMLKRSPLRLTAWEKLLRFETRRWLSRRN